MPDIQDETKNMTATDIAAYYFEKGYTPEQVKEIIAKRKMLFPTISEVLNKFMGREDVSVEKLSILSGIKPSTIYRIMRKERNPTRNTILRMAIALALDFKETQVLLKSGNCSLLSASRDRDLVIMNGISQLMDCETINKELEARNMPDLNIKF